MKKDRHYDKMDSEVIERFMKDDTCHLLNRQEA